MRYRALDELGDYSFGGNSNSFLTASETVHQAVVTRLRLLLYEWWEQVEDGLPMWQKVISTRDRDATEKLIRERIENTQHVKTILKYDPQWNNESRTLTIYAVIETEYGIIELLEEMG